MKVINVPVKLTAELRTLSLVVDSLKARLYEARLELSRAEKAAAAKLGFPTYGEDQPHRQIQEPISFDEDYTHLLDGRN